MLKKIQSDMINAMKEKDNIKKETLRLLISEIKKDQIDLKKELNNDEIIKIIKRGMKTRKEALELFKQGNREDLASKTLKELEIIQTYLPKQLSASDLEPIITDIIKDLGAETLEDTGKVMQAVMSKYGSQTDGKTVQQIVASKLGKQHTP